MIMLTLFAALLERVSGHGAVTKPVPRKLHSAPYCPWCIGEHNPDNSEYGIVNLEANPATPCIGTSRGDPRYDVGVFGAYPADLGASAYVAGQSLDTTIVLNADHGGLAQWSFCPHSEPETEDCFKKHVLTQWTDVHAYWGGDSSIDHWKDNQHFPQTVTLPRIDPGPITLRWLWKCKFTDEIFASCIDVHVLSHGGPTPSGPPSSPPSNPTPAPKKPPATLAPKPKLANPGDGCSARWEQCGGKSWTGATCCNQGIECFDRNVWYAQCGLPNTLDKENCSSKWHQCGGEGWSGPTTCCSTHEELQCVYHNESHSQCHPPSMVSITTYIPTQAPSAKATQTFAAQLVHSTKGPAVAAHEEIADASAKTFLIIACIAIALATAFSCCILKWLHHNQAVRTSVKVLDETSIQQDVEAMKHEAYCSSPTTFVKATVCCPESQVVNKPHIAWQEIQIRNEQ
jgi:hypothetical protein